MQYNKQFKSVLQTYALISIILTYLTYVLKSKPATTLKTLS